MTEEIIFRKARKEDAQLAAELIHIAIGDIAEQLTGYTDRMEVRDGLSQYFLEEINRLSYRNTLVAEQDGMVAGIAVTYAGQDAFILDKPIINHLKKKNTNEIVALDKEADEEDYYIDTVCVHPNFRWRGIGSALLNEVEKRAIHDGLPSLSLNVAKDNSAAKKLYKNLGFLEKKIIQINGHPYDYMVKNLEDLVAKTID